MPFKFNARIVDDERPAAEKVGQKYAIDLDIENNNNNT